MANPPLTHLTHNLSTTAATSFSTASVTPPQSALVLVTIMAGTSTGTPPTPTVTGNGITYGLIDVSGTSLRKCFVFAGMLTASAPTTGAITMSFGSTSIAAILWSVDYFTGVDTSGTNGSGAIVQSLSAAPTGTAAPSPAFTTAPTSGNSVYGAIGMAVGSNSASYTPGASWTLDTIQSQSSGQPSGLGTQYDTTEPPTTNVVASWTNTCNAFIVGVEVKAATAVQGNLTVTGSGALSFAGTPAPANTLAVTGSGTTSFAAAGVTASGSLAQTGSGTTTFSGGPGGSLARTGSGSLSLSGTPIASGTLAVAGSGTTAFAATLVTASGALARTGSGALALAGSPIISGALARTGAGVLTVSGFQRLFGTLAVTGSGVLTLHGHALWRYQWWTGVTYQHITPLFWDGTTYRTDVRVTVTVPDP